MKQSIEGKDRAGIGLNPWCPLGEGAPLQKGTRKKRLEETKKKSLSPRKGGSSKGQIGETQEELSV